MDLPAGHYFFVPQVQLSSGDFYWLSGPRPATPPFTGDLQAWIRNSALQPDWLRVGTDIVGGVTPPQFNGSFSLHGQVACPTVTISPPTLPGAKPGVPYAVAFSASGDPGPFAFSESGALPSGFSFGADGSLTGTTTQGGTFPITVRAVSSDGCSASEQVMLAVGVSAAGTKPTLSSLSETNSLFAVARTSTPLSAETAAKHHKKGTVFSFNLDQPASVKIAIRTKVPGRRVGNVCKPPSRKLRRRPRCMRTVTIATLTRTAHPGLNKVAFTGRIRGRALKPRRYQAIFTAIDAAGASPSLALRFRVVNR
jgi:putative Ig domain-containing protein